MEAVCEANTKVGASTRKTFSAFTDFFFSTDFSTSSFSSFSGAFLRCPCR